MKLKLSLLATSGAKKKYPRFASWKKGFGDAARLVLQTELPEISSCEIRIVIETDEELRELNRKSLRHDYYTDIITFEIERTEEAAEVEIYISADRAKENTKRFRTDLRSELLRLVIHGILHVAGYSDKKPVVKKRMQARERFFLVHLKK
jgi:rRNA maturation RNase YbeY